MIVRKVPTKQEKKGKNIEIKHEKLLDKLELNYNFVLLYMYIYVYI